MCVFLCAGRPGLSPHYIVKFFQNHGSGAWRMLGGVMLCVTGAEALFADMGHFSHSAVMVSVVRAVAGRTRWVHSYALKGLSGP